MSKAVMYHLETLGIWTVSGSLGALAGTAIWMVNLG